MLFDLIDNAAEALSPDDGDLRSTLHKKILPINRASILLSMAVMGNSKGAVRQLIASVNYSCAVANAFA